MITTTGCFIFTYSHCYRPPRNLLRATYLQAIGYVDHYGDYACCTSVFRILLEDIKHSLGGIDDR